LNLLTFCSREVLTNATEYLGFKVRQRVLLLPIDAIVKRGKKNYSNFESSVTSCTFVRWSHLRSFVV